jgi:hypothetical protein
MWPSGQKPPLGRILRNFRLSMRIPKGTLVLVLLYYILHYYYCKKKPREIAGYAQNILPVTSSQVLFRLRDFRWRDFASTTSANMILSVPIYYSPPIKQSATI